MGFWIKLVFLCLSGLVSLIRITLLFLIFHSSVVTMSQKHSLIKLPYLDPETLTSDTLPPTLLMAGIINSLGPTGSSNVGTWIGALEENAPTFLSKF